MIKVDLNINDQLSGEIKSIKKKLQAVPQQSLDQYKQLTPIRSGNARRKTRLANDTIVGDYPYAERLDNGWSKQAPDGMTVPFERWLRRKMKSILGK